MSSTKKTLRWGASRGTGLVSCRPGAGGAGGSSAEGLQRVRAGFERVPAGSSGFQRVPAGSS
eukprot:6058103-Alexandrium_andersonii.AAC.1